MGIVILLVVASGGWLLLNKNQNSNTIKIGWIGPLTGDGAIVGVENLKGIQIKTEEINNKGGINGKKIEIITEDDKYDAKESVNAYNKLTSVNNVRIIFIETYDAFLTLAARAEKDDILLVNSLDSTEEFSNLSKNVFSIGIYDESIGYSIAQFLNSRNIKDVALITNIDDAFSLLTKNSFKEKYSSNYLEEDYTFGTNDYRSILTKVSDKEYIVLIGWEEAGRIVKQARELGIDATIIGIDTFVSENFKKNAGNNIDGLYFTFWTGSQNNPEFNNLMSEYQEKYGKKPDNLLFMVAGFDSAGVLLNSMSKCENVSNIDCIKNNLENTKDFQGAAGLITIDKDHVTRSIQESMFTYKSGIPVKIEE